MRVPRQFNVVPVVEDAAWPDWFRRFVERYVAQTKRLAESLSGPRLFSAASITGGVTVALRTADVVAAVLIGNATVTMALTDHRAGDEGLLELTQDGTGGHTVTWANVLWTNATPPTVAAGAGKRTLVGFTHLGDAWVGRVVASNF